MNTDRYAADRILDCIRELSAHVPGVAGFTGGRPAAVLIPLLETPDGLAVLFEQRASHLDIQPGEICFPGGGIETGEDPSSAVLRETEEELCVRPEQITLLAALDGLIGPSGAPIWPFAGMLKDYRNTWSADEVAETFTVPLEWLMTNEPDMYMTELVTVTGEDFPYKLVPGGRDYPWARKKNPVYFYRYGDRVIWGLTAHILTRFLRAVQELL